MRGQSRKLCSGDMLPHLKDKYILVSQKWAEREVCDSVQLLVLDGGWGGGGENTILTKGAETLDSKALCFLFSCYIIHKVTTQEA